MKGWGVENKQNSNVISGLVVTRYHCVYSSIPGNKLCYTVGGAYHCLRDDWREASVPAAAAAALSEDAEAEESLLVAPRTDHKQEEISKAIHI